MERRKFLVGMGSLAAGAAATMGTGAFNEVQAHRTVSLEAAADANAYLGFDASPSEYAQMAGGSPKTLVLNFDSANATPDGGEGVNAHATTQFLHLFDIINQGTQTVGIQIDTDALNAALDSYNSGAQFHFFVGEHGGPSLDTYDKSDMASVLPYNNPNTDPRVLTPGDVLPVGCYMVNVGGDWDVEEPVTVNALEKSNAQAI